VQGEKGPGLPHLGNQWRILPVSDVCVCVCVCVCVASCVCMCVLHRVSFCSVRKETYLYAKRDLFVCQNRPTFCSVARARDLYFSLYFSLLIYFFLSLLPASTL